MGWWPCLVFSRVENWYWDVRTTGETRCNFLVSDTRIPNWFRSRGNSSWWNRAICCEWGNAPVIIGNDEAELELSVESKSFVNRVNDQVRKRQKRISNVTEDAEKHPMMGMFMSVTMESAVFMGTNYLNNCHSIVNTTALTPPTNVRHIYEIGVRTRWDLRFGDNWLGESIMEIPVIDWWRKCFQSSAHEGLRLFWFCIVSWVDTRKSIIERCMGAKIRMDQIFSKLQKLWQNRRRANGIRVEFLPRIRYVAAQWRSQTFIVEIRWDTREISQEESYSCRWFNDNFLWNKRQHKRMSVKCQTRISVRKENWKRTMVIYWTCFRKEIVNSVPPIQIKTYEKWLRRKQRLRWKLWERSVRRTTASLTTTGTTRTTSSSQCTTSTPMTTLTSTIAWCTSCIELAHSAYWFHTRDDTAHLMAQVLSNHTVISMSSLARSLWLDLSLLRFTGPSCLSPSSSSIPSCLLSSTTRSSWEVFATPPQMRVRTPWTLSTSHTGYEPNLLTFGELTDSSVPFSFMIPSTDQRRGWRDTRRDAHKRHTEDKSSLVYQKACQSVSRRRL